MPNSTSARDLLGDERFTEAFWVDWGMPGWERLKKECLMWSKDWLGAFLLTSFCRSFTLCASVSVLSRWPPRLELASLNNHLLGDSSCRHKASARECVDVDWPWDSVRVLYISGAISKSGTYDRASLNHRFESQTGTPLLPLRTEERQKGPKDRVEGKGKGGGGQRERQNGPTADAPTRLSLIN